jgi:N-acyl homoserine lactone hydrolase
MSDDIRLYMFDGGTLKCHVENIKMNQGLGDEYEIPVPWYLITHPRGNVVIDGGNAPAVIDDAAAYWGPVSDVYWPVMTPEQAVVPALRSIDVDPASVKWIVQSHLHLDHTGALASLDDFPNAQVVVTLTEYEYGHAPDWFAAGAYIDADFIKPGVPWVLLEETDDGFDLFGDGTLKMWRSPGHAPGHQSFEVNLPSGDTYLLTVDAAYTKDHWDEKALPGFVASAVDTVRSVRRLKLVAARTDAVVVTGHDPDQWATFKHAPEYYA